MHKHMDITVSGKVQGVGFRYHARATAQDLVLSGFAENQPDGTVKIEVEGEEENLQNFLAWCKEGPDSALVTEIKHAEGPLQNYTDFSIG